MPLRARATHFQRHTEDSVEGEAQVLRKQVSMNPKEEALKRPVEHLA